MNIAHLSKAKVLAGLYNASRPLGMGVFHFDPKPMGEPEPAELLQRYTYFDYIKGRVMKVDLQGDELETQWYNRDNGDGAAEAVIAAIEAETNAVAGAA